MSDGLVAATTDIEKENLEAHVELCWQRYQRFHDRLVALEDKVDTLADEIKTMREQSLKESRSLKTAIITSSATVIAGLIGLIALLLNAPH